MRFLKEPLVHFLAIGAALFLLWAVFGSAGPSTPSHRIVVDQATADRLARNFALRWRRPPTEEEWKKLVDDHVTTEILVREARKLGLDQGDVVIRQRLREKMEFLGKDLARIQEPTDEDLRSFLQQNADYFLVPDDQGGHLPPLEELRPTLVREWKAARREEINAGFLARLKQEYTVVMDLPPDWTHHAIEVPAAGDTTALMPGITGESPR